MRLPLLASLLVLLALDTHAETFQVTRMDDPNPDACMPGDCSLREAMSAAAANDPFEETDEIVLPAGTYTLVRGPLDFVYQRLRVHGAGSTQTRVVIDHEDEGLFATRSGGELALVGLGLDSSGAAVVANEGSSLSLDDVVVENGSTSFNGSVEVRHSELRRSLHCTGQVLFEDSTIFNLYVMPPQQGSPAVTLRRTRVDGTLYPDPPLASTISVHTGTLTLEDATIADSTMRLLAPATTLLRGSMLERTGVRVGAGSLTVEDSTVTSGSIQIDGDASDLRMRRVHYVDNTGPVRSEAAADVTIEDSLFEGNLVRALYAAGGAQWNVSGSSFVDNRVDGNAGGAIVLEDATVLRIRNSTFSGNSVTVNAAANGARGAAIGYRNGSGAHLILTHVTVVAPAFVPAGVIGTAIGGLGGGVAVDVSNSIVRGSCGMDGGVMQNNAGNIESPGNGCGLDPETNLVGVDAASLALGPLGNYGGPTATCLPADGSLAIDRASTPQCLVVDQRGYARPGGLRCDVGAVEADADDTVFVDGFDG